MHGSVRSQASHRPQYTQRLLHPAAMMDLTWANPIWNPCSPVDAADGSYHTRDSAKLSASVSDSTHPIRSSRDRRQNGRDAPSPTRARFAFSHFRFLISYSALLRRWSPLETYRQTNSFLGEVVVRSSCGSESFDNYIPCPS